MSWLNNNDIAETLMEPKPTEINEDNVKSALSYFEELQKLDSANEGLVVDEEELSKARDGIKELLTCYGGKIKNFPGGSDTCVFVPVSEGDMLEGNLLKVGYFNNLEGDTQSITIEVTWESISVKDAKRKYKYKDK